MNRASTLLAFTLLTSPASAQDFAIVADPTITPGSVRTTDVSDICFTSTRSQRHWSRERDDKILSEYGLPPSPHPTFEVDHSIPLELGGSDLDSNLWPQPRRSIEPIWNAERKDVLENRLHALVCNGQLDIVVAQRAIADDWTEAYRQYVGPVREQNEYSAPTVKTPESRLSAGITRLRQYWNW